MNEPEATQISQTYTDEQRQLNAECSTILGVEDCFATDARLLPQLFAEIRRRKLEAKYCDALVDIVLPYARYELTSVGIFALLAATPEQHAQVFVEVCHAAAANR